MGNIVLEETPRVAAAVRRIQQQLPETWSVRVVRPPRRRVGAPVFDAAMVVSSPGSDAEFLVEVKAGASGSRAAHSVVRDLRFMAEEQEAAAVLLVTDFAGPALREACEQAGVSYVDESGWLYLRNDASGMLVAQAGAPRPPGLVRRESVMNRLDGPGASAVIRALWGASTPVGVRALANEAHVSPGTSAKVLPALAQYGALERGPRGEVLTVERRLLLERWVQDYQVYDTNPKIGWFLAARGPAMAQADTLRLQADIPDLRVAFTGYQVALTALPKGIYPVIPDTLLSMYSSDPDGLAERLRLRPADRHRANVVIIRPRDESLVAAHSSYVPAPQALADLMTMGGRFPELAEQVLEYATHGEGDGDRDALESGS